MIKFGDLKIGDRFYLKWGRPRMEYVKTRDVLEGEHPVHGPHNARRSDGAKEFHCFREQEVENVNAPKRIFYRDFVTGKRKWTGGKFVEWQRGGPLSVYGAIVQRQASTLFIPHYLIEDETLENLPPMPRA